MKLFDFERKYKIQKKKNKMNINYVMVCIKSLWKRQNDWFPWHCSIKTTITATHGDTWTFANSLPKGNTFRSFFFFFFLLLLLNQILTLRQSNFSYVCFGIKKKNKKRKKNGSFILLGQEQKKEAERIRRSNP